MVRSTSQQVHIADVLKSNQPALSFEFFPPKTPEGAEKLRVTRAKLAELDGRAAIRAAGGVAGLLVTQDRKSVV